MTMTTTTTTTTTIIIINIPAFNNVNNGMENWTFNLLGFNSDILSFHKRRRKYNYLIAKCYLSCLIYSPKSQKLVPQMFPNSSNRKNKFRKIFHFFQSQK